MCQVHGRGEYLVGGSLDTFQYVHHCYKYDQARITTRLSRALVRLMRPTDTIAQGGGRVCARV